MNDIFQRGRRLISQGNYADALRLYQAERESDHIPSLLLNQLNFNIALLKRKTVNTASLDRNRRVIGIVVPDKPHSGLYRDAQTIGWAFSNNLDVSCSVLLVRDNIYTLNYLNNEKKEYTVIDLSCINGAPRHLTINHWLAEIDALIILEALNPSLIDAARRCDNVRQIFFMPNLEWAVIDHESQDTRPWEAYLRNSGSSIVSIARTPSIFRRLAMIGIHAVIVPWSVPDEVISPKRKPLTRGRALNILFNGGNLGYRDRRGLDIVIKALHLIDAERRINVVIKSNFRHDELGSLPKRNNISIRVDTQFLADRNELLAYYDQADVVLYPSRFEGFGLSLLEALHRNCYVLATDGEPMSELVPPYFLRIQAQHAGNTRLAQTYEPVPQSIADNIHAILDNPDLLAWNNNEYKLRQIQFCRTFSGLVRALI